MKENSNMVSGARLDRIYVQKSFRGTFFNSCIIPTALSDHHYTVCLLKFLLHRALLSTHFGNVIVDCCKITILCTLSPFFERPGQRENLVPKSVVGYW